MDKEKLYEKVWEIVSETAETEGVSVDDIADLLLGRRFESYLADRVFSAECARVKPLKATHFIKLEFPCVREGLVKYLAVGTIV